MESDRATQRLWATIHRRTRRRLKFYADAEDISFGTAASRLVRAGFERHAEIDRNREIYSREAFNDFHLLPPAPTEGDGVRVKIALDDHEIERVQRLAHDEFEIEATMLSRLLLWGFFKAPRNVQYEAAWTADIAKRHGLDLSLLDSL